jgi:hypothetical protein
VNDDDDDDDDDAGGGRRRTPHRVSVMDSLLDTLRFSRQGAPSRRVLKRVRAVRIGPSIFTVGHVTTHSIMRAINGIKTPFNNAASV